MPVSGVELQRRSVAGDCGFNGIVGRSLGISKGGTPSLFALALLTLENTKELIPVLFNATNGGGNALFHNLHWKCHLHATQVVICVEDAITINFPL